MNCENDEVANWDADAPNQKYSFLTRFNCVFDGWSGLPFSITDTCNDSGKLNLLPADKNALEVKYCTLLNRLVGVKVKAIDQTWIFLN